MPFKKQIIRHEDGTPYMIRRAINTPLGGIKLHHILLSDEDRDCHDHPWSFLSIILWGGYFEHRPMIVRRWYCPDCDEHYTAAELVATERTYQPGCPDCGHEVGEDDRETERTWHGPGSVLWRPLPSTHRLELPAGRTAWSLVLTGPKRREWGFHTICGWIPWTQYWQRKREGC